MGRHTQIRQRYIDLDFPRVSLCFIQIGLQARVLNASFKAGKQGIVCLYKKRMPLRVHVWPFLHVFFILQLYVNINTLMYLYILFGYFLVPFSCICFHFWGCHHLPLLTRHSETRLKKTRSALKTTPMTDERPWAGEIGSV